MAFYDILEETKHVRGFHNVLILLSSAELSRLEMKGLIVGSIALSFFLAIFFLAALLIVYPIRRNRSLIAVLVAGSFLVTTFVLICPGITRKIVSPLCQSQIALQSQYDTFAHQIVAALFRTPDSLILAIGVGSFLFGLSATICGLLFWYAGRKRESTKDATTA